MPPKTLAASIQFGKKRKRHRSSDIVRSRPSAAVKKQRSVRQKARQRDTNLYASIIGIPDIGDLILAFSTPKDTPDVIYAVTNSQGLCNTVDWMRSRIVRSNPNVLFFFTFMTLDGDLHSPTDEDRDVAKTCSDGLKMWYKWNELHRGGNLPAVINHKYKMAWWFINGKETRSIFDDEFDAYFASTVSAKTQN